MADNTFDSEFPDDLNLDSLLNFNDDIFSSLVEQAEQPDPLQSFSVSPSEVTSEFPDLSSIDLSLLSPIKEESTIKQQPEHVEPETKKRKKSTKQSSNKKPKIVKQEPKPKKDEEKYSKRLQANKKSAQASRERKKQLKSELEVKLGVVQKENRDLQKEITELETENKVLKNEYITLQNLIMDNTVLAKLFAKASAFILPPSDSIESIKGVDAKPSVNAAAAMYLMIMLYSFRQHFNPSSQITSFGQSTPLVQSIA